MTRRIERLSSSMQLPLMAACLCASFPAAAQARDELVRYEVRAGDTLYDLAARYLRHPGDYSTVQRINGVRDPRRIQVGSVLKVPRKLLRQKAIKAQILSFKGDVSVRRGRQVQAAMIGKSLQEGDFVRTGLNAFLTMKLPDGSIVTLPSRASLRIARLRQQAFTNNIERNFQVVDGEVRASVKPFLSRGDSFRFETPSTISAVRGTELRVSFDRQSRRSATEVLEGKVEVGRFGKSSVQQVSAGFGVIADADKLRLPQSLLAAPSLAQPDLVQDKPELSFTAIPLKGASTYRAEIASDAGFINLEAESEGQEKLVFPGLADGIWFVRLSAIDADGLQGFGRTYSFKRRLLALQAGVEHSQTDRINQYIFRWQASGGGRLNYRFQLFREGEKSPVADESGLEQSVFAATDLPPGKYFWRVGITQFLDNEVHEKWLPTEELIVVMSRR